MTDSVNNQKRRDFIKGTSVAAVGAGAMAFPMISTAQTVNMRFQSTWPQKDIFHEYAVDFADKVNSMTGGRLKIEVLPAGCRDRRTIHRDCRAQPYSRDARPRPRWAGADPLHVGRARFAHRHSWAVRRRRSPRVEAGSCFARLPRECVSRYRRASWETTMP